MEAVLSGPPVPLMQWQRDKKILLIRSDRLVAETVTCSMFGMLLMVLIGNTARHQATTGQPLLTRVFIDEFQVLRPGAMFASLWRQGRKWGFQPTVALQSLPQTPEFKELMKSVSRFEVFKQADDEGAEQACKLISTLRFSAQAIKDEQYRERNIVRGYNREVIKTKGKNKSKDKHGKREGETENEHVVNTPINETVIDVVKVFKTPEEQRIEDRQQVLTVGIGQRIVVENGQVSEVEPLELVKSIWKNERQRRQHLAEITERIHARPHYYQHDWAAPSMPQDISDEPSPLEELLEDETAD